MTHVTEILLADAETSLRRELGTLHGRDSLDAAFAAWLVGGDAAASEMIAPIRSALSVTGGQRSHKEVAILGYALAAGQMKQAEQLAVLDGIVWLTGRNPFVDGAPIPCCTDPVALLGVALGAKFAGDAQLRQSLAEWMEKFLATTSAARGIEDWQRCLFAASHLLVSATTTLAIPSASPVADIRVALRSKGLLASSGQAQDAADEREVLQILKGESTELGPVRAAIRFAAYQWIRREGQIIDLARPTLADVGRVLRGVPAGLKKWTWETKPRTSAKNAEARQWHIDNEYHVQNLLWLVLAPCFPDLKEEEYTPSIGDYQPRVDLCIPSLQLIIEVKFMRESTKPKDIIEEVAADANLYFAPGSQYRHLIPFVWDDVRRSEDHPTLESGLKQIPKVVDAIVVSRPGSMT